MPAPVLCAAMLWYPEGMSPSGTDAIRLFFAAYFDVSTGQGPPEPHGGNAARVRMVDKLQKQIGDRWHDLELVRRKGDRLGEVRELSALGRLYSQAGDSERALECLYLSLAIARE